MLRYPGRHAEPIQLFGVWCEPGLLRVALSHQRSEALLQRLGSRQRLGVQPQGAGFKEQQALFKALGQGRLDPLPLPAEHPLAGVVARIAAEPELLQQRREAVVRAAAPLAAQIHHGSIGQGVAQHPPAHPGPGFQHAYPQALLLQPPRRNQA